MKIIVEDGPNSCSECIFFKTIKHGDSNLNHAGCMLLNIPIRHKLELCKKLDNCPLIDIKHVNKGGNMSDKTS
jgi:hypothetical protein